MSMFRIAFAMVASLSLAPASVAGQAAHRREQDEVFAARMAGQALPLRQIEQRIVPRMSGFDYLGPEFDPGTASYRLKFMRGGSVVWVDVDARTGAIIGRSGY